MSQGQPTRNDEPRSKTRIWVGTSGYVYPDWVGPFYPPGTRPGRQLAYYCRHFPLVELNFTFYRLPTPTMLSRLVQQSPEGFQFVVKLPRTLSHEQNAEEIAGFRRAVDEVRNRGRLLGLLCQLPQACHNVPKNRAWLASLAQEFQGYGLAVEFRHHSWSHPDVPPWLGERNLDLVAVDVPDLPGLYPRGLVHSGPHLYVRFHSRNAKNWYQSDKGRYDYDYNDQVLHEWIEVLNQNKDHTDRVLLLFNNCQRSQAVANAQRMHQLLSGMGDGVEVIQPFVGSLQDSEQRLLFD